MHDSTIIELMAKQAIRDVLAQYCHSLDRMNKKMAYSVWHDDGTAHYLDMFEGTGKGFVDWVWQAHLAMERHSHQITNSLIQVTGDRAVSETYVTVSLWALPDQQGTQQEIIGKGRYLDRWSCRADHWAIDHRIHVLDMQSLHTLNRGYINAASRRDSTDPAFALFNSLE